METLVKVKTMVFDKTGTLTKGNFEVKSMHPNNMSKNTLLAFAAKAEYASNHPIAAAIKEAYGQPLNAVEIEAATVLHGFGTRARVGDAHVLVGSKKLMDEEGVAVMPPKDDKGTTVYVAVEGRYAGAIVLTDKIKRNAAKTVSQLKDMGIERTVILSVTGSRQLMKLPQK